MAVFSKTIKSGFSEKQRPGAGIRYFTGGSPDPLERQRRSVQNSFSFTHRRLANPQHSFFLRNQTFLFGFRKTKMPGARRKINSSSGRTPSEQQLHAKGRRN